MCSVASEIEDDVGRVGSRVDAFDELQLQFWHVFWRIFLAHFAAEQQGRMPKESPNIHYVLLW